MAYKVGEFVIYEKQYGGGYGKIEGTANSDNAEFLRYEVNRSGSTAWVHELQILASLTKDDVKLCDKFWQKKVRVSAKDRKHVGRVIGVSKGENGLSFSVFYLDTLAADIVQYRHNEMEIVEE